MFHSGERSEFDLYFFTLIFVDETWTKTNLTGLGGWYVKGKRLVAHMPHGHRHMVTLIAGLRCDGICAPFVLDGPVNGQAFLLWVKTSLVPTLNSADIVILDNLGSQKSAAMRRAIRPSRRPTLRSTARPGPQRIQGSALSA